LCNLDKDIAPVAHCRKSSRLGCGAFPPDCIGTGTHHNCILQRKPTAKYMFFLNQQGFNFAQAEVRATCLQGNQAG